MKVLEITLNWPQDFGCINKLEIEKNIITYN